MPFLSRIEGLRSASLDFDYGILHAVQLACIGDVALGIVGHSVQIQFRHRNELSDGQTKSHSIKNGFLFSSYWLF
jgi:hypothetical protein